MINWQLSKQGIRWPVSLDRIAGSGVDLSRSSTFLKLSADKLLVFKWSQDISHMKHVVNFRRTIKILISNWTRTRKFSQLLQEWQTVAYDFAHHDHALVTFFVQFLCCDWSKCDRWVHAENLCSVLNLVYFHARSKHRERKLFFLYTFHRIIFLLLIVSSLSCNFNRCTVCFQSFSEHRLEKYSKCRAYQTLLKITHR